jgi:hypothetical protein
MTMTLDEIEQLTVRQMMEFTLPAVTHEGLIGLPWTSECYAEEIAAMRGFLLKPHWQD